MSNNIITFGSATPDTIDAQFKTNHLALIPICCAKIAPMRKKTIKQDLDLPIEHQHNPAAIILLLQINSK